NPFDCQRTTRCRPVARPQLLAGFSLRHRSADGPGHHSAADDPVRVGDQEHVGGCVDRRSGPHFRDARGQRCDIPRLRGRYGGDRALHRRSDDGDRADDCAASQSRSALMATGLDIVQDVTSERKKVLIWRANAAVAVVIGVYAMRNLEWDKVTPSWLFLLKALGRSWLLAVISIVLGAVAAIPLALARVYGPMGIRHAATILIEAVRATPELM